MKHFTTSVNSLQTHVVYVGLAVKSSDYFREKLLRVLQVTDELYATSGELSVLSSFDSWIRQIDSREQIANPVDSPVYVYANVSTGKSVAFIASYGFGEYPFS